MTSDLAADLRELIEAERLRFGVPGCAVVVVAGGKVVLSEGFGTRDVFRDLAVTDRTLFPIASSTKTFTAALCAALVQDGKLAWDRPVRDYMDDFAMKDPVVTKTLSVFDMLCHRSGLPRHDLLWYSDGGEMDRRELVRALRHLDPNRGFREEFQYNNLLYLAAGEVAGHVDGTTYETAVQERLLDPLKMTRTNFSVDDLLGNEDTATPYVFPYPENEAKEVPHARLDLIAPAGSINSCAEDMASWLLTLLGRGVGGWPPLLGPGVLSVLRAPAVPLPMGSSLVIGNAVGYCLGLMAVDYRGHRVLQHGGNIDGFSSQVTFIPGEGCGIVVLSNRDGTVFRDVLPLVIFDRVLGLAHHDHGRAGLEREQALRSGPAQARRRRPTGKTGLGPVRPLVDYVGRYRHPAYGELVVDLADDGLYGRYRSLSGGLTHRHLEVFDLTVDLGGVDTPLGVQFSHDFDAHVVSARVVLEGAVEPVLFKRVPDSDHLTDKALERLAGTYHLGPLTTVVERRGAHGLMATVLEGSPRRLELVQGLVFSLDGRRVEFTEDGRVVTWAGEFTRR